MLTDNIKNIIIGDFRNYKKWKARIKAIDNQLDYYRIETSKFNSEPSSGGSSTPSDPTLVTVQQLESLRKERAMIMHYLNRVECCLDAMTKQQRDLVYMKYFEKSFSKSVMTFFNIEKSEYYNRINEILTLCAEVCGYMTKSGQIKDKVRNK